MCGIVGYIGTKKAQPILLNCLGKLEYRGYDSCGVAVSGDGIELYKNISNRYPEINLIASGGVKDIEDVVTRDHPQRTRRCELDRIVLAFQTAGFRLGFAQSLHQYGRWWRNRRYFSAKPLSPVPAPASDQERHQGQGGRGGQGDGCPN